ncbi:hypothetical protein LINPERPRIM_LOCUS9550 [Linum perenne]
MATLSVADSEPWLPSKPEFNFPSEFPYEFDSAPDSACADDDNDFFAGLTRRLTQQISLNPQKKRMVARSPESTLSGLGSMSVSSNGSPNGDLSPTKPTPFGAKSDTWDLIYAAADQVAKLKMKGEAQIYSSCKPAGFVPNQTQNPAGFYSFDLNVHPKNQYQQFSQEPAGAIKEQCPSVWGRPPPPQQQKLVRAANWQQIACGNARSVARPPPQHAWPPLQNQHYQQMQSSNSAFLSGGSGAKRECAGTGVFLPRRYGNAPPDSKKKPNPCSTVLLPAKVVHALNLNLNENEQAQPRFNPSFAADYAALLARRNAVLTQLQNKRAMLRPEARLPQDWSY